MSTSVTTAAALNNLSATTAAALSTQSSINSHLRGGIMILNQRVDLVQEQVDILWRLAQLGCEWHTPALCVTGIPYHNMTLAANLSRELSRHLTGNWTREFDKLTETLRLEIININSTRVDPELARILMSWIAQAAAHLKEWVGMGSLALLIVFLCALCLFCLGKMLRQQRRDRAFVAQAFAAIEIGQSPEIWLAALGKP